MAIIECKKCGYKLPEYAIHCNNCGYEIKGDTTKLQNTDKKKSWRKNLIIYIVIFFVLAVNILIWQSYTVSQVKTLYSSKKYETASAKANILFLTINPEVKELKEKLNILQHPARQLELTKNIHQYDNDYAKDFYVRTLFDVLESCIGYSQLAEEKHCIEDLNSLQEEAKNFIVNEGYTGTDIKEVLLNKYNNDEYTYLPLRLKDENRVKELILDVANSITQSDIEKVNNKRNPLRIEEQSLTSKGEYTYYYGTVKNYGDKTYYFVKIRAVYMDKIKNVLTTDWTYAVGSEGIRPGESVQFEIMTKVRGDVEYGKIEIFDYD